MVLAAARHVLDSAEFFTITEAGSDLDTHGGRVISARFRLPHRELPKKLAGPDDLLHWQQLVGRAVGGQIWRIHPSLEGLDNSRVYCNGLGGEVGRGFYWWLLPLPQGLDGSKLLEILRFPDRPELLAGAEAWLAGLPTTDPHFLLDLLYVEQRLGHWASPQGYGTVSGGHLIPQVAPIAQRVVVDAMYRLPVPFRQENLLAREVCRELWPQVLDIPINEYTGWTRRPRQAADVLQRLSNKVVRKARSLSLRSRG